MEEKKINEVKKEGEEIRVIDEWSFKSSFKIPDCCLELWESCPHVAPKPKKIKKNIAL